MCGYRESSDSINSETRQVYSLYSYIKGKGDIWQVIEPRYIRYSMGKKSHYYFQNIIYFIPHRIS